MKEKKEQNHYKPIATKIDAKYLDTITKVAEKTGLTVYRLLQIVIENYLSIFSDDTVITKNTRIIIERFCNLKMWKGRLLLSSGIEKENYWSVNSALFIVEEKRSKYPRSILVHTKKYGDHVQIVENINEDAILTTFLNASYPFLIEDLKTIKERYNCMTLSDALKLAVQEKARPDYDPITKEIEDMFDDLEGYQVTSGKDGTNMRKCDDIGKYRRKLTYDMDNLPNRLRSSN